MLILLAPTHARGCDRERRAACRAEARFAQRHISARSAAGQSVAPGARGRWTVMDLTLELLKALGPPLHWCCEVGGHTRRGGRGRWTWRWRATSGCSSSSTTTRMRSEQVRRAPSPPTPPPASRGRRGRGRWGRSVSGKNGAWITMGKTERGSRWLALLLSMDRIICLARRACLMQTRHREGGVGWGGGLLGGEVPQRASSKPSQRSGAGWSQTKGRQWLEPDLAPTCLLQWCVFLSTLEPDQGSTTACPFRALSGPAAALRPSHRRLLSCRASTPRHPKLLQPVTPRLPGPLWKGDVPMWFW